MRRLLKFLHTLGAIGMMGALASLLVLYTFLPTPDVLAEYVRMRQAMGAVAEWVLLPSLGIVLISGLLSMAWTDGFHSAGWAWAKLATGVLMFEGTLFAVQGPLQRGAEQATQALAGELDPAQIALTMSSESGSIWIILGVAAANVVLGVWRPKFGRKRPARAAT